MSACEFILILLALAALVFVPAQRRKCGVNDLSRWKQYGGHLERPAPPAPMKPRSAA